LPSNRGIVRNFEGGVLNFFVWMRKFRGILGFFFLKNAIEKIFSKRGWGGLTPKIPP